MGNEITQKHDAKLRVIAEARWPDPLNTWPDHNTFHERTLMGARLYDSECLRCHLEDVAAEQIKNEGKPAAEQETPCNSAYPTSCAPAAAKHAGRSPATTKKPAWLCCGSTSSVECVWCESSVCDRASGRAEGDEEPAVGWQGATMREPTTAESWAITLVVGVMMWVGFFFGYMDCRDSFRKEAVRRGVAEYDTKTGAWKWSVEPIESEERR